jgi:release factor glutamine methyltransferase
VVERALGLLRAPGRARRRVADVGTGSGAIALALASEPSAAAEIVAIDRSADALAVARGNAERLRDRLRTPVRFVRCDLLAAIAPGSLDLVVSNPPYVGEQELFSAAPELNFEPREALQGGDPDGLGVVRRLAVESRRVLRRGGWLVSEIGAGQGGPAADVARAAGFSEVAVGKDLAGRDRVLVARHPADTLDAGSAGGAAER